MSKRLKEIIDAEKTAHKLVEDAEKNLHALKKHEEKIYNEWPSKFRCKKCGLAFKTNEIGYKDWEVRHTKMKCQPMGDYDIWQVVETQHLACCPKCGHDFGVKVYYSDFISSTPYYSRYEDKPELTKCYKKCLSKRIKKLDSNMIKYIKNEKGNNW